MALQTAYKKIEQKINKYSKNVNAYRSKYSKAKTKVATYTKASKNAEDPEKKLHYGLLAAKWDSVKDSSMAGYKRNKKALAKAEAAKKKQKKDNLAAITDMISEHSKQVDSGDVNEGKIAIFRSTGEDTDIVYIATTGGESDSTSTDVSSWARDENLSPRQSSINC